MGKLFNVSSSPHVRNKITTQSIMFDVAIAMIPASVYGVWQFGMHALLVLIAVVSSMSPNFFTLNNLFNILQQTSVNAIMAVGMTLVILTSGIDLSVGSLLALTGAIAASIVGIEVNALVAVAAALAAGAAIGAVTGVIVAKGRVQAFIATLVMMLLLRGVTMVYTNGSPVNTGFTDNADLFGWFGIGRPLGVPTPVWIMAIVFLAAWYMLHHTRLGRYIYALGGNEAATRLSGISVNKVKIIVYSLCGLLASLAGIIEVARLSSAQPTAGTGYELDAIAAVVLGAYYEPCLLVLRIVEPARAVDQLHEHALRRVLRVGRAAQKRVAQPVHRRGVAVEQCGYVDVVLQRFSLSDCNTIERRVFSEEVGGYCSGRRCFAPQACETLRAAHADLARL